MTRPRSRDSERLLLASGLLVLALSMPPLPWPRASFDYLAVFDITQSMGVADYRQHGRPLSRLAFARHAMALALAELPCGSKLGLAAFTGYRSLTLLAPVEVCDHYGDLLSTLDQIDDRMRWAEASEVAKGLYWALRAARDVGGEPQLLFFSDGHESPPLQGAVPAPFGDIRPGEIRGLVIGTGGDVARPIPKQDAPGHFSGVWQADEVIQRTNAVQHEEHLSALREGHLQALAARTGLDYVRLEGVAGLSRAMRSSARARVRDVPTDFAWVALGLALAMLCATPLGTLFSRRAGTASIQQQA